MHSTVSLVMDATNCVKWVVPVYPGKPISPELILVFWYLCIAGTFWRARFCAGQDVGVFSRFGFLLGLRHGICLCFGLRLGFCLSLAVDLRPSAGSGCRAALDRFHFCLTLIVFVGVFRLGDLGEVRQDDITASLGGDLDQPGQRLIAADAPLDIGPLVGGELAHA